MPKQLVHHGETPLHLAFSCYVFDDQARLLVTWRARTKQTWPGVRTNSCCGHPLPGEPMRDAVVRRADDELGLALDPAALVLLLPRFRYRAVMDGPGIVEHEICPVWKAVVPAGARVSPVPSEVDDYAWLPWADFAAEAAARPASVSPWCGWQVAELAKLGADPLAWPAADDAELPPAARTDA